MLKRRIRTVAVTGITIMAAALVTLSTTGASAAVTTAAQHRSFANTIQAAATGCVTYTFTISDQYTYELCVRYEQILLNDLWYKAGDNSDLGPDRLLTVDGYYGPNTQADAAAFIEAWDQLDFNPNQTTPTTWWWLCAIDKQYGFTGAYWHDAGCATESGL